MADFKIWVVDRFGDEGTAWLKILPQIINELIMKWDLSDLEVQPISHYNYIAFCKFADNTRAVLKICYTESDISSEIVALRALQSEAMIKPLAFDEKYNAILLPFIKPGLPLYKISDDETQTQIAAELIRDIPIPLSSDNKFPLLTEWFRKITDHKNEDSIIPTKHLINAQQIFGELQKEDFSPHLMHGDLHHHNILQSSDGWVVVDPKGVIGNPLYETSCFLYNPSPDILNQNPEKLIRTRVEIFAEILPYQADKIAAMAYCQSVLSAVWCIEDRQNCWQNAISFAEIFKSILCSRLYEN